MTALHDAARQAALDARDRVSPRVSDYVALTIAEAAMSVLEGRPVVFEQPDIVDAASQLALDDLEPRWRSLPVRNAKGWL